jgi:hypothetical protein
MVSIVVTTLIGGEATAGNPAIFPKAPSKIRGFPAPPLGRCGFFYLLDFLVTPLFRPTHCQFSIRNILKQFGAKQGNIDVP